MVDETISVKVDNVSKRFGGVQALSNCNLQLDSSTRIFGLIGPNGAGKTTLFNVMTGFLKIDEGNIYLNGEPIANLAPYKIALKGMVRTFQLTRNFRKMTVFDNLLAVCPKKSEENKRKAIRFLEDAGLIDYVHRRAEELSHGQQKILELTRTLMLENLKILLLDEPTFGLDHDFVRGSFSKILKDISKRTQIFVIEHNVDFVTSICEKIFVLSGGRKIAEGLPQEITKNQEVIKAYLGY